jgi:type II secretory pathway component GspD/PulD (secretin)
MITLLSASWVNMQRRLAVLLVLLSVGAALPALAQNAVLEVIALKYRSAEQVIPVLKPLLDARGSLSGMQNQLIIRTTPANLAELKQVLATLDAMPRRLMITVRQDADSSRDQTAAEVSGRVSSGNATVIVPGSGMSSGVVGARRGDDTIHGRIDSTRSLDSDRNTQTLQVLEGNSAFIRIGQSVPLPQRQVIRTIVNGQIVERIVNTAEYRDVMTGFYALPRLAGDRVTLEISPQHDTLPRPEQNLPRGSVNVQRVATTVSGRLGEWIEIGGLVQGMSTQQSVTLGSTREVSADNRRILLKVEEIR